MRIFRKKTDDTKRLAIVERKIFELKCSLASIERRVEEIDNRNYEQIVYEVLCDLLRERTINILMTMNEKEVVASVIMDELRELQHKRGELERALDEVNHALDKAKKKKEEA